MDQKKYHEDLSHIRKMMERGSRFVSLSGLSGVFAGLTALIGSVYAGFLFRRVGLSFMWFDENEISTALAQHLAVLSCIVLVVALVWAWWFSYRKSSKVSQPLWNSATRRMLEDFGIPLLAGAVYCIGLLYRGMYGMIPAASLIIYGLALINAARHTLSDIRYLGFSQLVLGLAATFFPESGLLLWSFGFGILHIVYGLVMYKKYDLSAPSKTE